MSLFGGFFDTTSSSSPTGKPSSEPTPKVTGGGKTKRLSKYGSRRKVWNGSAEKTKGGLTKDDLMKNKYGRIVSAKRHGTMKKRMGGGEADLNE
jgi:hypothetical protein